MKCQFCQVHQSNVHVTEVETWKGPGSPANSVTVKHLCELCAQQQKLPFVGPGAKASAKLWKLMSTTTKIEIKTSLLACASCGLTQLQLRKKGRVGCPQCYEVFGAELEAMLERIHGATDHTGRTPNKQAPGEVTPDSRASDSAAPANAAPKDAVSDDPLHANATSFTQDRLQRIGELKGRLEKAIHQEEFEVAADLRDQLADLEENEA